MAGESTNRRPIDRRSGEIMSRIHTLCDTLLGFHRVAKRPVADLFLPGLTNAEFDRETTGLALVCPQSVRELYAWRNGIGDARHNVDAAFFEAMIMFPLASSVAACRSYRGLKSEDIKWQEGWYPLFDDRAGFVWAIQCPTQPADDAPIVIVTVDNTGWSGRGFDSLEQLLATMVTAFEQRIFFVADDGWLDTDTGRFARLSHDMNPGSAAFWSDADMPYHLWV
jgi:hypothetical protein